LCTETEENGPFIAIDSSTASPAVGNPEYLDDDAVDPWTADEGSYLTCGSGREYYDYSHAGGQLIAA